MRLLLAWSCALMILLIAPAARADKRVALVIGNSAYQNTAELRNPMHDAIDMASALKRLNFEVLEGRDLDKRTMERLVRQFAIKVAGADLALFFYAGHGLQMNGQNYLLPIDARLASEGDADFETVQLTLVLKQMEREAKTSIVLLDACRDNPLARNLARTMGTRSARVTQGLAEVKTGVGTLIGFSTQPGNVASDGGGRNSPYAGALLRHIEAPGKDVSGVLIAVRNDVLKATEGRQVPWEHTSLTGQVFLKLDRPDIPPPATIGPDYDREAELSFWNSVKDSESPAVLETYLQRYPNGTFAGLARVMIDQLRQGATVMPPSGHPASPGRDHTALARDLQVELQRVGCYPGAADGNWGRKTQSALQQFAQRTKVDVETDEPTLAALNAVRGQPGRICPLSCGPGTVQVDDRCVAKAEPGRRPARAGTRGTAEGRETGKAKPAEMCWGQDGRSMIIVPCTDVRANSKAY